MMTAQLGMIPQWQMSTDPGVNIKLNPHVTFPEGWTQRTVQPVGPYYAAPRIANANLGRADGCCCNSVCSTQDESCCYGGVFSRLRSAFASRRSASMRGMGMPIARQLGMFDSWAYENRKWLVLGGLGLIAAAGVGITASVLK